jgi:hypothetical protein
MFGAHNSSFERSTSRVHIPFSPKYAFDYCVVVVIPKKRSLGPRNDPENSRPEKS